MLKERVDTIVVQADGVQKSSGRFHRPPWLVTDPRFSRNGFRHDRAKLGNVDDPLHFSRVAERSRGNHDRVFESQSAE